MFDHHDIYSPPEKPLTNTYGPPPTNPSPDRFRSVDASDPSARLSAAVPPALPEHPTRKTCVTCQQLPTSHFE